MAAENEATNAGAEGDAPKKSKGPLKLLGGVVGLIAAGTILAVIAMPKKEEGAKALVGPAMHVFFPDMPTTGNPLDDNFSRYVKFTPSCYFLAYDLAYPESRRLDPHYETLMRESIQLTISRFPIVEIMSETNHDAFTAELETVAEPILFPVHLGPTAMPYELEEKSGLRLGDSQDRFGTFRGPFYEHKLKIDAGKKTLQIDGGPVVRFSGGEFDVLVEAEDGTKIYVDVSGLKPDFVGDLNVGVMGRIRRFFTGEILAQ